MILSDAYYEQKFENEFLRSKGDAFQTFFERLMGLAYKADFMACRPWGNQGDRKNDGFLKSERRLFQVYAPNEMDAAKAKAKILEDFEGAKAHWNNHFDCWVFMGCGCGAASFGLLLLRPGLPLVLRGIDTGPEMVDAANANANALGLAPRFAAQLADVEEFRAAPPLDFALANPPFRAPGTGRACPSAARDRARFEGPGGFAAFAHCAGRNLRRGGALFLVHLAERLPEVITALAQAGVPVRELLPVQGRAEADPRLALLAAAKGGGASLTLLRPLVLYEQENALTLQALAFCPHLAVNARRTPLPRQAGKKTAP